MSLTRTNPAGWAIGDKLTSSQANGVDTMVTNALDKRSGQTDTLSSVVSCSGAGRIVPTYVAVTDANTTITVGGLQQTLSNAGNFLTANRTYTLSISGAQTGDIVSLHNPQSTYLIAVVDGFTSITLATLGASGPAIWATFIYFGSGSGVGQGWQLLASSVRPTPLSTTFLSSGTWTCPSGVTLVSLSGCGGGGGGGSGAGGTTAVSPYANSGGSGGGGAIYSVQLVSVTPGITYTVTIGSGGSGALGVGPNFGGSLGGDGGDTIFGSSLVIFRGAGGGTGGGGGSTSIFNVGGSPIRPTYGAFVGAVQPILCPQSGGTPSNFYVGNGGIASPQGYDGGLNGALGSTNGSAAGGGGGGGGGGGPFGAGVAGGAGGAGSATASVSAGSAISLANSPNNSGAGGAGSGAGGQFTGGSGGFPGNSGNAGSGGSGRLTITAVR